MKKVIAVAAIIATTMLSGCAASNMNSPLSALGGVMGGGSNDQASLGAPYQQVEAKVLKVRPTTIHEQPNGIVSSVASGSETQANSAVSQATGGGMMGGIISGVLSSVVHTATQSAENAASATTGILVEVRTKTGMIMSITQSGKVSDFHRGQGVLVDWYSNGQRKVESI